MSNDAKPIEVGDRFESKDTRDGGRIVEVRSLDAGWGRVWVQSEVNPTNPAAVGRRVRIGPDTLRKKYRRISR